MKFVIDVNLSPHWTTAFAQGGWEAVHWTEFGAPDAPDSEIMQWAKANGYVVFTHDLDFGTILAATQADAPSVIQVRTQKPFSQPSSNTSRFWKQVLLSL